MKKPKKNISDHPFGICGLSCAPVRRKPDDRSEMVTQILFGETVRVVGKRAKNWLRVVCSWDEYEGWIDPKQIMLIDESHFEGYSKQTHIALELCQPVLSDITTVQVLMGSNLPYFDGMSFKLEGLKYVYSGQVFSPGSFDISIELVDKLARRFLNVPYLWGGRSPFGIDCSGLTQVVYKMLGIALPRDAKDQVEVGTPVDFIEQVQTGDLAFFENKEGEIHHVGIIIEENKIIHASGKVRIDDIDHYGIYNGDRRSYSHKLRIIKRIISA